MLLPESQLNATGEGSIAYSLPPVASRPSRVGFRLGSPSLPYHQLSAVALSPAQYNRNPGEIIRAGPYPMKNGP